MPGKSKEDPTKTQQQEIADKKHAFLAYFRNWPVKKAAAEAVNRSPDTIDIWLKDDQEFSEAFLSARSQWSMKQSRRLDPSNLLTNMYEELKPPKQEVDQTVITSVTINHVQPHDQLSTDAQTGSGVSVSDRSDND